MHNNRLHAEVLRQRPEPPFALSGQVLSTADAWRNAGLAESSQQLPHAVPREAAAPSHLISLDIEQVRDGIRGLARAAEFQDSRAELRNSAERSVGSQTLTDFVPRHGSASPVNLDVYSFGIAMPGQFHLFDQQTHDGATIRTRRRRTVPQPR